MGRGQRMSKIREGKSKPGVTQEGGLPGAQVCGEPTRTRCSQGFRTLLKVTQLMSAGEESQVYLI